MMMKITKFTLFCVLASMNSVAHAVTREECKEDYLPSLLECIDNSTGIPDCDYLPIPDFAMPQNPANEMGYWIQELRSTPTSHVYALSENAYSSLIVVDVPPTEEVGKRKDRYLKGSKTGSRDLQEEELDELMGGHGAPTELSADGTEATPVVTGITVALVDFPPTFQQFDAEGKDAGSHIISALGEILENLGAKTDDIGIIQMIYSHGHKDHIGLANHTYTYVTEKMGMDPSNVPIIATEGVKEHIEHAIKSGLWSYSAPMPTDTFEDSLELPVGLSTTLSLTTFNGHQFGEKDVIVFLDALDEENPAIMMVVDVVFPKWVPFFSFALTTDLLQYIGSHDVLLEFPLGDDGYLVGGHLNQVGDRNDIILNQELTLAIVNAAGEALQTVNAWEVVGGTGAFTPGAPNFGNSWAGFGAYFNELQRVCARKVLEEHGCDFGGLDVTLYSSCNVAQSFLRIDI